MKRIIIILLFVGEFLFNAVAQNNFINYLTTNMRKDIAAINTHIKTNSAPDTLLKDLNNLLIHMTPQREYLTTEEILQIARKLQYHPEFYDLEAACRLSLAYLYRETNEMEKSKKLLSGLEVHIQNFLNQESTTFQDFICALAKYLYYIPDQANGVTDIGVNAPTTVEKNEIVTDILSTRWELRCIEYAGLNCSNLPIANKLLMMVLKNTFKQQANNLSKESILNTDNLSFFSSIISRELDTYIRQWIELEFPAQYITNPLQDTRENWRNEKRNKKKTWESIRELSYQGYGPASYIIGVDYEEESVKEESQDALIFYKLASDQGSAAGTIRLAHCLTIGYSCNVNQKKAFEILQPLIQNVDFAKNGAFAYAVLLEEGMGGEVDILDIMHYYSIAAEKALSNPERKVAKERVNNYYEKFYK